MQGGAAERHSPELRQDLGRHQGAPLHQEVGYLLHDALPELLGAEAVELVLNLSEAGLDAGDLVLGGLGPGGERGVPRLKTF